jgi:hypothetical protein
MHAASVPCDIFGSDFAEAFCPVAHDLHAHEPMGKKRRIGPLFEQLQLEQVVPIRIEAFSLDSTLVKVHPDGTGASKNGQQAIGKSSKRYGRCERPLTYYALNFDPPIESRPVIISAGRRSVAPRDSREDVSRTMYRESTGCWANGEGATPARPASGRLAATPRPRRGLTTVTE